MAFILMTSCRNGGTFEKKESTATPTKETEIVGVVGGLNNGSAATLTTSRTSHNVGVGICGNGRRTLHIC